MPLNLVWTLEARIADGPKVSTSESFSVEAYDSIEVTVDDGDEDKAVEVQPAATAAQVQFLLVRADIYGDQLTYKINDPGNPGHELDRQLLLAGAGAIGLLGAAPQSLYFTNHLGEKVTVRIIVARDATP
jgi:hypothetical protein